MPKDRDINHKARSYIKGPDGKQGVILQKDEHHVEIELEGAARVRVPAGLLTRQPDGSYLIPFNLKDLKDRHSQILPVVQEELHIEKRVHETGQVAVHIEPYVRQEVVEVPLADEQVVVERVVVNRPIDSPIPVRQEGNVTIVPVFEEVLVVRKQLILKEEVRITRNARVRQERKEVPLRTEEVHVLRSQNPQSRPDRK